MGPRTRLEQVGQAEREAVVGGAPQGAWRIQTGGFEARLEQVGQAEREAVVGEARLGRAPPLPRERLPRQQRRLHCPIRNIDQGLGFEDVLAHAATSSPE